MNRKIGRTLLVAVSMLVLASAAQAQDAVYSADQLTERPQLVSPSKTAQLIRDAYSAELRDSGVAGTVQITFVIDAQGKVEPGSVEVVASTAPQLTPAALKVAPKLEFKPGKKDAQAVRTKVVLPLVFR